MGSSYLFFLKSARDRFYRERDPQGALGLLTPYLKKRPKDVIENRVLVELACLCLRTLKRYSEAKTLYESIQDNYQAGYCELLQGRYTNVQKHWLPILQKRTNHWCLHLYGMTTRQLNSFPTLFEIRNHLECDINNLIRAGQLTMVDNIVSYADFLQQFNLETCKFIGRAMINARDLDPAWRERGAEFLMRGQKALPNDPEVYYHLGQYKIETGELEDARLLLNQCLLISASFSPARELMEATNLSEKKPT